eukprot:COSAG04_NODE_5256_length_1684_cov_1.579180_1_plen_56_part_00
MMPRWMYAGASSTDSSVHRSVAASSRNWLSVSSAYATPYGEAAVALTLPPDTVTV